MVIVCGWCSKPTANADRCTSCGHEDPARPWVQRGATPPAIGQPAAGRPRLDPAAVRRQLAEAERALDGRAPTVDALAEELGVDPATVRRWRKVAG